MTLAAKRLSKVAGTDHAEPHLADDDRGAEDLGASYLGDNDLGDTDLAGLPGPVGLVGRVGLVGADAGETSGPSVGRAWCVRPDLAAAADAAREFLAALGVNCDSPGMLRSPERMAAAYAAMLTAPPFEPTTFPNDGGYDELVVVSSIPVQSVCEHHLLPFSGQARVGYLPGERIIGLSKLARVVEFFARRPQVQERLTQQIACWLDTRLSPQGVGVVIEAEHTCMTLRGVRAIGSTTRTTALSGRLRDDQRSRSEFLAPVGA